ncbi:MAG: efflux RND transporter periplasmic adaptor subunit [Pseudomonadota bacterium]
MGKPRTRWSAPVVLAVLGIGLGGCAEPEPTPLPTETVVVDPARQENFVLYGNYIGVARASLDVEVRARVDGFVEEIAFREGSFVREGDLLYRIDNRPYVARVNRLRAETQSARAAVKKAERDLARIEPLYAEDAASQLDLDEATAAYETSQATLAAKLAQQDEAELELEFTEIHAQISGLAGATRVDVGALVGSSGDSLLTTIKRVDPMYVEFRMTTLDYLNAQRRKRSRQEIQRSEEEGRAVEGFVRIILPDDQPYLYWGDIDFTEPQINPDTGTFAVRAVVGNPNRELLPGQFLRTKLELDTVSDAIIIDERVIQIEQGGSFVMVAMPDDTVERRFIITGPQHENDVVVTSGLGANERVIVEGFHKVQHGQPIQPLTVEEYERRRSEEAAAPQSAP